MTQYEAESACVSQHGGHLATITSYDEFQALQMISAMHGGNTWLGLYDKTNGANCPRSRTCADWTWYSGEPTTYLFSSAPSGGKPSGQSLWDHPFRVGQTDPTRAASTFVLGRRDQSPNEPNNWPQFLPSATPAGLGEHGVGFMNGYGLNDWAQSRVFPFVCETVRRHLAAGDLLSSCFRSHGAVVSVNVTSFPVAPGGVMEQVDGASDAGFIEKQYYLSCRLPPGPYALQVRDVAGRLATSPVFYLAPAPFTAALSLSTVYHNDTVMLSWAPTPDGFSSPVITRLEFSRMALTQVCLSNSAISSRLGETAFSARSVAVRLLQLPGCSGTYAVTMAPVGCHRDYTSNFIGSVAVLPRPQVTRLLSCPTGASWAPGNPLALAFAVSDARSPAVAATLVVTGTTTSTELAGATQLFSVAGGVANLGALFPSRDAAVRAWPFFPESGSLTIRLSVPGGGGIASADCLVRLQPPAMAHAVLGLHPLRVLDKWCYVHPLVRGG